MAIEIIPKRKKEVPLWRKIIFIFSLFLFIATLSLFISFKYLEKKEIRKLSEIEDEISKIKGEEEINLEKKIEKYKDKIKAFDLLLSSHKSLTSLFKKIEENTHPFVFYRNFSFSKNEAILEGETENFQILYQQIKKFEDLKKEKIINKVSLNKISLEKTKEGKEKVIFILSLFFNKEFLTKK